MRFDGASTVASPPTGGFGQRSASGFSRVHPARVPPRRDCPGRRTAASAAVPAHRSRGAGDGGARPGNAPASTSWIRREMFARHRVGLAGARLEAAVGRHRELEGEPARRARTRTHAQREQSAALAFRCSTALRSANASAYLLGAGRSARSRTVLCRVRHRHGRYRSLPAVGRSLARGLAPPPRPTCAVRASARESSPVAGRQRLGSDDRQASDAFGIEGDQSSAPGGRQGRNRREPHGCAGVDSRGLTPR